jgi:hypothetical protein
VFYTYTVAHVASARCSGLAWHARAPFAVLTASAAAARLHMTASETLISLRHAVIMFISAQINFDLVRSACVCVRNRENDCMPAEACIRGQC